MIDLDKLKLLNELGDIEDALKNEEKYRNILNNTVKKKERLENEIPTEDQIELAKLKEKELIRLSDIISNLSSKLNKIDNLSDYKEKYPKEIKEICEKVDKIKTWKKNNL